MQVTEEKPATWSCWGICKDSGKCRIACRLRSVVLKQRDRCGTILHRGRWQAVLFFTIFKVPSLFTQELEEFVHLSLASSEKWNNHHRHLRVAHRHRGVFSLLCWIFFAWGPISRVLLIQTYNREEPMFCNKYNQGRVRDAPFALHHHIPSCIRINQHCASTSRCCQQWLTINHRPPCHWRQIWALEHRNYGSLYDHCIYLRLENHNFHAPRGLPPRTPYWRRRRRRINGGRQWPSMDATATIAGQDFGQGAGQ